MQAAKSVWPGGARYSDSDLEPLRAALVALSNGELPRVTDIPEQDGMLAELWPLLDAVATRLGKLGCAVEQRAEQARDIAKVTAAVARGDLTRKATVDVSGEQLKHAVNAMVDHLAAFADEVKRIGSEGWLGAQASDLAGTWKDLADKVASLRATREQDWLNTSLARLSGLAQGHRDPQQVAQLIITELAQLVTAQYGAFYLFNAATAAFERIASHGADGACGGGQASFELGEGVRGQAAASRVPIVEPAEKAIVAAFPILFEDHLLGLLEFTSRHGFSAPDRKLLDQFVPTLGAMIDAIMVNSRAEKLLAESRRQQAELRRSNAELAKKAAQLARQCRAMETKNVQVERARQTLEERAVQLATSSQYKSEFLANMSHELRTPLNSLLVLAELLADNPDGNLSVKQVAFARTIHEAGSDLLQLIDDILDLSKVEAGKMEFNPSAIALDTLLNSVAVTFRPTAVRKGLRFQIEVCPSAPTLIYSDEQRLRQILRNLLSNALKFTSRGGVSLRVRTADDGPMHEPGEVIAFSVTDTGIGIADDKLDLIFGAFQQADGATSRSYGGTGLGLSISREIANLIGGQIRAKSRVGYGSIFTFYLPVRPAPPTQPDPRPADLVIPSADTAPDPADPLYGATVLIVDDDVRNVFALASALERYGTRVRYAENGKQAIEFLDREHDIALMLMDVMMPELDGYATTAAIRQRPGSARLPIIAVTAKAMHGDREKALAAGASDYVTKPVDISRLTQLMRSWLSRGAGGD